MPPPPKKLELQQVARAVAGHGDAGNAVTQVDLKQAGVCHATSCSSLSRDFP